MQGVQDFINLQAGGLPTIVREWLSKGVHRELVQGSCFITKLQEKMYEFGYRSTLQL